MRAAPASAAPAAAEAAQNRRIRVHAWPRTRTRAGGRAPAVLRLEALVHVELQARVRQDAQQRRADAAVQAAQALRPHGRGEHAGDAAPRARARRRPAARGPPRRTRAACAPGPAGRSPARRIGLGPNLTPWLRGPGASCRCRSAGATRPAHSRRHAAGGCCCAARAVPWQDTGWHLGPVEQGYLCACAPEQQRVWHRLPAHCYVCYTSGRPAHVQQLNRAARLC